LVPVPSHLPFGGLRVAGTLGTVSAHDRSITLALLAGAAVAWGIVALVLLTVSPVGDAGAQMLGAVSLGAAAALTMWPLLWTASRREPGSLATAARRASLVGLVVSVLVILRVLDLLVLPVVVFLVVGAFLVELAVSLRR
jgi:hypothetical protein